MGGGETRDNNNAMLPANIPGKTQRKRDEHSPLDLWGITAGG